MTDYPITIFINLLRIEFAKFEATRIREERIGLREGFNECMWSAQHAYAMILNDRLEKLLAEQKARLCTPNP
jgi:hypothetical protein